MSAYDSENDNITAASPISKIMVVDDDLTFCQVLSSTLSRRGFKVSIVHDSTDIMSTVELFMPDAVILDIRMPRFCGIDLISPLRATKPDIKIVILTGYASIATAVEAIKLGAIYYLTKPVDVDEILSRLGESCVHIDPLKENHFLSARRLEWEHVNKVLIECDGNISAAARILGMHRRTLQRKLNKHPVRR